MAIRKTPVATSPTPGSTSFCLLSVQNHHIPAAPAAIAVFCTMFSAKEAW
jgi:hypothetical protein